MKWSDGEELVLGRSLEPLVVAWINMYKNRYGMVPMLVFMFAGCSEG
jgi:hypothetical protein